MIEIQIDSGKKKVVSVKILANLITNTFFKYFGNGRYDRYWSIIIGVIPFALFEKWEALLSVSTRLERYQSQSIWQRLL